MDYKQLAREALTQVSTWLRARWSDALILVIMLVLGTFVLVLGTCALAGERRVLGSIEDESGKFVLYAERGKCPEGALAAEITLYAERKTYAGCASDAGDSYFVVYEDGDIGFIPKALLRAPSLV